MQSSESSFPCYYQNQIQAPHFADVPQNTNHGYPIVSIPPPQFLVPPPPPIQSNSALPFIVPPPLAGTVPPLPLPFHSMPPGGPTLFPQANFVPFNPSSYVTHQINSPEITKNAEDDKLTYFLQRFHTNYERCEKSREYPVSVAEYVASLKETMVLFQQLTQQKEELEELVESDSKTWNQKVKYIVKQQDLLCDKLSKISNSELIEKIVLKLSVIQKRRKQKRYRKSENRKYNKILIKERLQCHQEIDQWQDELREKDLQNKKEAEMKKEADYILAEVRKKIHVAKRTLEVLKKLEKARQSKSDNANKKGILVSLEYEDIFKKKCSEIWSGLTKQLSDYEAEETAMKVMLETEHEGQRELEEEWKIKKMKLLQQKKQAQILSSIFGDYNDPDINDPVYLFHQYYNSAQHSLQNLVEIRRGWDVYLVPPNDADGSNIPQKWIIPSEPSSEAWLAILHSSKK